ncbi:MAG: hypothetical protein HY288_03485, partial [Planctomycetia bacterium]|nr:hypothetical protein [Planctomycetia bacterium]
MRVDPQHGSGGLAATVASAAGLDASQRTDTKPWVIIVDDARDFFASDRAGDLQSILQKSPQLLLVACDTGEVEFTTGSNTGHHAGRSAIDITDPLGFEYVGPIPASDSRQLIEVLAKIKQLGQPTVLHLKTRKAGGPTPVPHAAGPWESPNLREDVSPSNVLRHIVSRELAQRAHNDARIIAISTSIEAELLRPWAPLANRMFRVESGVSYALQWCATLASGGSRPFVFLSWQELQNSFGQVRQDICLKRAAVTLIVEPGTELPGGAASSMGLAGVRQLPHLCLLSPKDS